jgi:pyrimidine deaminase RibD-like protein
MDANALETLSSTSSDAGVTFEHIDPSGLVERLNAILSNDEAGIEFDHERRSTVLEQNRRVQWFNQYAINELTLTRHSVGLAQDWVESTTHHDGVPDSMGCWSEDEYFNRRPGKLIAERLQLWTRGWEGDKHPEIHESLRLRIGCALRLPTEEWLPAFDTTYTVSIIPGKEPVETRKTRIGYQLLFTKFFPSWVFPGLADRVTKLLPNSVFRKDFVTKEDEKYVKLALEKAVEEQPTAVYRKAAIIVKDGAVIASATRGSQYYNDPQANGPSVEHRALSACPNLGFVPGATMYIAQFPCGIRLPPSIELIASSGIKRVVYALDNDRGYDKAAIMKLRMAGVEVAHVNDVKVPTPDTIVVDN